MTRPDSPMASLANDLYQLFKNEPLRAHILELAEKAHRTPLIYRPIEPALPESAKEGLEGAEDASSKLVPISIENALADAAITTEERAAAWTVAFWQAHRPDYVAGKLGPQEGGANKLVQGDPLDEVAISASVLRIYAEQYLEIPTDSGQSMDEAKQEALKDWMERWKADPTYSAVDIDPGAESGSLSNTQTQHQCGTSENGVDADRKVAFDACYPSEQKAYLSYRLAIAKKGRPLEDRDAWEALRENDWSEDFTGPLDGYEIPDDFETWSRQLRVARKALHEQKYTSRSRK
ncbi:hypothetical protein RISK_002514 [Rhodopirellula islandica]|uniref:Uncharacterized protein n=1 Tax=Rhodopirellula islandica TaxID=595434 RepID=A0A0J1BH79_RHOIS|nr:hypothetical protein [Rhodopirellula islandica]KLU05882.1 hypothetical protein RISK_002514 [Rhodopirellula islandica]